jgi:hypothetical protein
LNHTVTQGLLLFFVYFKLSVILLEVTDPLLPFENLFCAIFMGGIWDALSRFLTGHFEENPPINQGNCGLARKENDQRQGGEWDGPKRAQEGTMNVGEGRSLSLHFCTEQKHHLHNLQSQA